MTPVRLLIRRAGFETLAAHSVLAAQRPYFRWLTDASILLLELRMFTLPHADLTLSSRKAQVRSAQRRVDSPVLRFEGTSFLLGDGRWVYPRQAHGDLPPADGSGHYDPRADDPSSEIGNPMLPPGSRSPPARA